MCGRALCPPCSSVVDGAVQGCGWRAVLEDTHHGEIHWSHGHASASTWRRRHGTDFATDVTVVPFCVHARLYERRRRELCVARALAVQRRCAFKFWHQIVFDTFSWTFFGSYEPVAAANQQRRTTTSQPQVQDQVGHTAAVQQGCARTDR